MTNRLCVRRDNERENFTTTREAAAQRTRAAEYEQAMRDYYSDSAEAVEYRAQCDAATQRFEEELDARADAALVERLFA